MAHKYSSESDDYVTLVCECGMKSTFIKHTGVRKCPGCNRALDTEKRGRSGSIPCPHCGKSIAFSKG